MTPLTWSLLRCELVTICAGFSLDLICLWPGRIRPASLTHKSILTIAPESVESRRYRTYEIVHETTTVRSQRRCHLQIHDSIWWHRKECWNSVARGSTFPIFNTSQILPFAIYIAHKNIHTLETHKNIKKKFN